MRRFLAAFLLLPGLAAAQPRPFNCVGAEQLEDDVLAVPFARGSATLREAGRAPIAAAAELAKETPERNICVLGHADRSAGAETSTQLAAQRARAVANALAAQGVERDRIRAEARVGAYSGRGAEPGARAVTIVVLPAPP
ncbi:OmpA family protein [Falsiroseomonas sp. CW058]|uniref:OmpA family protein n=1 Tax=Falsiroseomonas sp. CW058 TaxID=3388664 RepID=UPI003D31EB6F